MIASMYRGMFFLDLLPALAKLTCHMLLATPRIIFPIFIV
jgi:hypothetical protein